jgi:hypothetical protein
VGLAALLVHARTESAKRFGLSRRFVESLVKPMMMWISLETAHKASAERGRVNIDPAEGGNEH